MIEMLIREDVLATFACHIHRLPFEARKDVQTIWSSALRWRPVGAPNPEPRVITWILTERPEVLIDLCNGYNYRESAMPCGTVLREALKHDSMAAIILYDEPTIRGLRGVDPNQATSGNGIFWKFFHWIDKGQFEVSADSFNTMRVSKYCTHNVYKVSVINLLLHRTY